MSNNVKVPTYADTYIRSRKYENYIAKSLKTEYNILEGSIRSSKSVANVLAFATNLLVSPDTLHMVTGTTTTVAKSVWLENDGLGLLYFFKGRCKVIKYEGHTALQVELGDRTHIILVLGLKNKGSYKGFRGMSIGMVGFTELDLLDPESVIEAINRTLAAKHRRFFMDFNPTSKYHMIYNEKTMYGPDRLMAKLPKKTNYMHCTIHDNPVLTLARIEDITSEYDPDSIPYKRFILGQRVSAEGLIYNVRDYNIIEDYDIKEYGRYVVVADPGINTSATSFILMALKKDHSGVDVLKEYWHRNADETKLGIKMPADYAIDFLNFINECQELMGYQPYKIVSDPDVTFMREVDRKKYEYGIGQPILDADKEKIEDRIKTGINYLYQGRLRFYKECVKTIESFKTAQYDEKKAIQGKYERYDDPQSGTMIDCVDVTEYGFTEFELELDRYRH